MATKYIPRHEDLTGASLTGTSGGSNRTYSLVYPDVEVAQFSIIVANAALQYTTDYTLVANVVTFLNPVWDNQAITIDYNTAVTTNGSGDATYATTEELNEFMMMVGEILNPEIQGDTRALEEVGTGDNTNTKFYIDNAYIVDDTYTLYYGATELASLSTPLTETTHYTLDKDTGTLTLTSTGVTLLGENTIYATYKFNKIGFKDSELADQLARAESKVNKATTNSWVDGSVATPTWTAIENEKADGKGGFARRYFTKNRPLPDISTNLNGAVAVGDTTVTVNSTAGFPSSGLLGIEGEKVTYSAKDATTFTVTALTTIHLDDVLVLPYVFEASNTIDGAAPTWTVLSPGKNYDLDLSTGRVYLSSTAFNVTNALAFSIEPPHRVPNRFRLSYIWGNNSIPEDIKQLTLMIAAQDLLHRAVRKAHTAGLNDFDPGLINVDEVWIKETIKSYKNARIGVSN